MYSIPHRKQTYAGVVELQPKSLNTQSAGPVRLVIFCSISIFLLAIAYWQIGDPSVQLVLSSRECTPPYLSTGISNLLQPAQARVVLGQLSTYLTSWVATVIFHIIGPSFQVLCASYEKHGICNLEEMRVFWHSERMLYL
jgi:hypothetical protein